MKPEPCHLLFVDDRPDDRASAPQMLPREIQKGWAAGFFCYLTKPFKVDELLETLDEALKFAKPRIPRPDIEDETLDQ